MASTPIIGELQIFGFSFAPPGWLPCDGRLVSPDEYNALFALIGTTYGGDGNLTFGLPDLRGRVALHQGQGPGLPAVTIGQSGGQPTATVTVASMPAHNHLVTGSVSQAAASTPGTTAVPGGNIPAGSTSGENYAPASQADGSMAPMAFTGSLQATGGGQAFDTLPPCLAINYCIAVEGIFPQQN